MIGTGNPTRTPARWLLWPLPASGRRGNDLHSQLNAARVARVALPRTEEEVRQALAEARREGMPVAVCGGRHAMGGQQFASGGLLLDTTRLNRVLEFDRDRGHVTVEAGTQWPRLVEHLLAAQRGEPVARQWG